MKVIIAGSRDITDYSLIDQATKSSGFEITEVVCGLAPGVDSVGESWAKNNGIPVQPFPAKWDDLSEPCRIKINNYGRKYNALAGFNRNQEMAQYADALVCITNGSPGSKDMIERMEKLDKPVYILEVKKEDV